jgi:hypothetical protein
VNGAAGRLVGLRRARQYQCAQRLPPALDDFGEVRAVARHAVEVPHRGQEQIGLAVLVKAWRDQAALDVHSKGPMPHSEAANDCTNR